jgi:hypothetical protein
MLGDDVIRSNPNIAIDLSVVNIFKVPWEIPKSKPDFSAYADQSAFNSHAGGIVEVIGDFLGAG